MSSFQHSTQVIPGSSGKLVILVLEVRLMQSLKWTGMDPFVIVETKF